VILLGHLITPGFALSHGGRSDQTHLSISVGGACGIQPRGCRRRNDAIKKVDELSPNAELLIDDATMSSSPDDLRDPLALVA
jgi:hypothetical protein